MTFATLALEYGDVQVRRAVLGDLDAIVALLAHDPLRADIDSVDPRRRERYVSAFQAIDADSAHLLVVIEDADHAVVGTMQLTTLPGLARGGATRLQIEAVRVRADLRGQGVGGAMIEWAIGEGRRRGATLVQLTSDLARPEAHRFYRRLGFEQSHAGFKLFL